ncbi:dihydrofolate synthase [Malassezia cuniculi]|uniref:Dihydrofolate synthase n=1 Tax=Malassezia cuniculi TaxID=948313 RepID=A0AAF0EX24_9BASI|nr:dihydrofolate synthase [Malassezia cuniculi]
MDLGLHRVHALLQRLGLPQALFPVIHVAGTNGKGSTTAYLDVLLTHAAGLRAARFNSPHLMSTRDSVRIAGGEPIDEQTWTLARQRVQAADEAADAIRATPFELLTAQALVAFTMLPDSTRPQVLVIEVGVGGRLDATNVFPSENVLASVICPIARDHEQLLGSGLAAITREKAGIIKESGLCVVADQTPPQGGEPDPEIIASLKAECAAKKARTAYVSVPWGTMRVAPRVPVGASAKFGLALAPTSGVTGPAPPTIPLDLEYTQARVAGCATALQTLWSIAHDQPGPSTPAAAHVRSRIRAMFEQGTPSIQSALTHFRWEGRCEWVMLGDTPVLLDGAHNEASAQALRSYLDACGDAYNNTTWVMAISQGKAADAMFDALFTKGRHRVAFVPFSKVDGMPWVRPAVPEELAEQVLHNADWPVDEAKAFSTLAQALEWAKSGSAHVVVCGSLYLVSDFYRTVIDSCAPVH